MSVVFNDDMFHHEFIIKNKITGEVYDTVICYSFKPNRDPEMMRPKIRLERLAKINNIPEDNLIIE